MRKLVDFDCNSDVKQLCKSGIKATDKYAQSDMRKVIWYYVNTSYTDQQILERMIKCTADYFASMPQKEYVEPTLKDMIKSVRAKQKKVENQQHNRGDTGAGSPRREVVIYQQELDKIAKLNHPDTQRLAFMLLVQAKNKRIKYPKLEWFFECNAEMFRQAWCYDYDEKKHKVVGVHQGALRVNGSEKMKRIQALTAAKLVWFKTTSNKKYGLKKGEAPAHLKYTALMLEEDGDVAIEMHNFDALASVLWYDRYLGYGNIVTCTECGTPVFKSNNKVKYCPECAKKAKQNWSA